MWLILIVLFLVGAGALFIQFNKHKSQDLMWEKWNYPYLDEVNNPRDFEVSGYQFLKISDQEIGMRNRVFLYPESEWYSSELSEDPHFWSQESRIFYNRDLDLFSVGLEYGSASWIFLIQKVKL